MLETIATILIILWVVGITTGYTLGMGNFIYVLLAVAILLFVIRLIMGPGKPSYID